MKTGPNDARRVVWAIRKLYIYIFRVLLLLTTVFRYYLSTGRRRPQKRAQTTPDVSFGPFVIFFFFFFFFFFFVLSLFFFFFSFLSCFIITDDCIRYYLLTGRRRPRKWAQTFCFFDYI